jgi:hypothetical protein
LPLIGEVARLLTKSVNLEFTLIHQPTTLSLQARPLTISGFETADAGAGRAIPAIRNLNVAPATRNRQPCRFAVSRDRRKTPLNSRI